jgi:uncharacterized phage protein (TIGR02220 family)
MNRTALNDERLSWKAKGIVAYMLSMPDDWKFYVTELSGHAKDGEDSLRSGIKELKKCGYIKRYPVKDEKTKKIIEWETHVYESPQVEEPQEEKPDVENPQVENPTLLSTDSLPSTDSLSIERDNVPFSEIVNYLNLKIGSNYRATTKKTKDLIKARWNEGFELDDFKKVIDNKAIEWSKDKKMINYLRPSTLFGTKFEEYLNQNQKGGGRHTTTTGDQYSNLF